MDIENVGLLISAAAIIILKLMLLISLNVVFEGYNYHIWKKKYGNKSLALYAFRLMDGRPTEWDGIIIRHIRILIFLIWFAIAAPLIFRL